MSDPAAGTTTWAGAAREPFPETRWELLERLRRSEADGRREAMEELCRKYWRPIYAYIRVGWCSTRAEAEDLTQGFFLWLLEHNGAGSYQPERAAFRTYLKLLARRYVGHHRRDQNRLKRGGGTSTLSLNGVLPLEERLQSAAPSAADEMFEREWRESLIAPALDRVRERLFEEGRESEYRLFDDAYLAPRNTPPPTHGELAIRHGIDEQKVTRLLFRVRQEIRIELRAELSRLTRDEQELKEEWDALLAGW